MGTLPFDICTLEAVALDDDSNVFETCSARLNKIE
jgi:hypothetical protein